MRGTASTLSLSICSSCSPESEPHSHAISFYFSLVSWSFGVTPPPSPFPFIRVRYYYVFCGKSSFARSPMPKMQLHNWNRRLFSNKIPARGVVWIIQNVGGFISHFCECNARADVMRRKRISVFVLSSLVRRSFSAWLIKFKWIEQISGLRDFAVRSVDVQRFKVENVRRFGKRELQRMEKLKRFSFFIVFFSSSIVWCSRTIRKVAFQLGALSLFVFWFNMERSIRS